MPTMPTMPTNLQQASRRSFFLLCIPHSFQLSIAGLHLPTNDDVMKYQLVLQWPAASIKDYDTLIEIEEILVENLVDGSDVDGHDAGSGEINIFIHTDDPEGTFGAIKRIIGTRDFWVDARVAYRELTGSTFTVLWPKGLSEFNVE
jgi:hypothetical protein